MVLLVAACSSTSVNEESLTLVDASYVSETDSDIADAAVESVPDSNSEEVAQDGEPDVVDVDAVKDASLDAVKDASLDADAQEAIDPCVGCDYTKACPPIYAGSNWTASCEASCVCSCPTGITCSHLDGGLTYHCVTSVSSC